jgi:rod shape-determining protein MreC
MLREENVRLRALMGVKTDPPLPVVFARTVIDARGPYSNTRLVDAGSSRGIVEGNPALSEHGLVGRVTGVAPDVSRVLLLTDAESRTPVLIERTNGRAILTGDGGPNPQLAYLRTHSPLREGDRVLTSGDGGVLPRGLPVGAAVRGADGGWRVALDSDAAPIDFVQILLFKDFAQLVPPAGLPAAALPSTTTEAPSATAPPAPPAKGAPKAPPPP